MSNTNQPLIEVGQIIPAFTLPGADGMPHSPWDYKQREHLVLLITRSSTTGETRGLLRAFAQHYAEFREEDCSILAISPDTVITNLQTQEDLKLPFALLADPAGEVISRYTFWEGKAETIRPSIVLADRYSALYQQWIADDEASLPSIEELLDALRYLNRLCTP
ncbi:MAG TPA: redoxin domain-containing protein [Ktedonobacteraceae bacterium]|nr:redoxin domain-containing protein [Ktedonobacteraceae bacterium]